MLGEMRAGFSQRFAARTNERDRCRQRDATAPLPAGPTQGTASGTGPMLMRTFG
jgi:hypothetical protein